VVVWDRAEAAVLFSSGMVPLPAPAWPFCGRATPCSSPTHLRRDGTPLPPCVAEFGITTVPFPAGANAEKLAALVAVHRSPRVIFLESPANPTMQLCDMAGARTVADQCSIPDRPTLLMVDNTFLGPIFCQPLALGRIWCSTRPPNSSVAILIWWLAWLWGVPKSSGRSRPCVPSWAPTPTGRGLAHQSLAGHAATPHGATAAQRVPSGRGAARSPKVARVYYPGLPEMGESQVALWRQQCSGAGSVISFDIHGGEAEAFRVLDAFRHIRLAVSLGGIDTLVEHPWSMTHAAMRSEQKHLAGSAMP